MTATHREPKRIYLYKSFRSTLFYNEMNFKTNKKTVLVLTNSRHSWAFVIDVFGADITDHFGSHSLVRGKSLVKKAKAQNQTRQIKSFTPMSRIAPIKRTHLNERITSLLQS